MSEVRKEFPFVNCFGEQAKYIVSRKECSPIFKKYYTAYWVNNHFVNYAYYDKQELVALSKKDGIDGDIIKWIEKGE